MWMVVTCSTCLGVHLELWAAISKLIFTLSQALGGIGDLRDGQTQRYVRTVRDACYRVWLPWTGGEERIREL